MSDDKTRSAAVWPDRLGALVERLRACADDPMWANHAEIPKSWCAAAANALEETSALAGHYMAQRDEARKELAAQRERMIADGWRQTRYVAPVTDCEACLTPDACAIRGQCGHYLREGPSLEFSGPPLGETNEAARRGGSAAT